MSKLGIVEGDLDPSGQPTSSLASPCLEKYHDLGIQMIPGTRQPKPENSSGQTWFGFFHNMFQLKFFQRIL
jgi:hypothetical protein